MTMFQLMTEDEDSSVQIKEAGVWLQLFVPVRKTLEGQHKKMWLHNKLNANTKTIGAHTWAEETEGAEVNLENESNIAEKDFFTMNEIISPGAD